MLRRVPVAVRLFGLVGLVVVFAAATFFFAVSIAVPLEQTVVRRTHEAMLDGEKSKLTAAVGSMAEALGQLLKDIPDEAGRKALIRQILDPIRFEDDGSGYFFVYQGTVNIALPPRPELAGRDLADLTDANGVRYVLELARQAQAGGGFVSYIFHKPLAGEEHKLSYAMMIPGTDAWIGSGVYIDNVRREEARVAAVIQKAFTRAATISVALFACMVLALCGLCLAIGYSVARPLAEATAAAENIAAGNFDVHLAAEGDDEAARLQAALNAMTDILRHDIEAIQAHRTEAEDKATLAQKALEDARRASQEVTTQANLRFQSLRKIAAAVAHQLRNPTTIIGGLARLLIKTPSPKQNYLEYLDGIIDAARRIERIATAVNDYSQIHASQRILTPAGDILAAARAAGEDAAARLGLVVHWEILGEDRILLADPALLALAAREVAVNAVEALPAGGGDVRLTAVAGPQGSAVVIEDNGKGIPEEERQFVMDPFYTTKSVGVGMGLTRAQRAMQEQSGSIVLDSGPEGTKVTLSLPSSSAAAGDA
ncbi:cache domain-containing protein [Solidesulfovibrio magneticus]|uniref:histidine kinase n=1 Tax=Solidesulfovibrio magneticus (strain ATCC 700980 / DSM 13731 / RS-1) TaxID=573370 RepID=C4XP90_SOLM1|nr:cache domain-containing protein [Solidesulfovibrio magneticus]BAH75071.1 putative sensor histidine kinase [Solidesulfovibrio magneticus RS-1]